MTRRSLGSSAVVALLTLTAAACGGTAGTPASEASASTPPEGSSSAGASSAPDGGLEAIGCATSDPEDTGDLTGAWSADDGGVYYIRQVGDCVWWFGTSLPDVEPGQTGQPGFANVAAGRVDGTEIELEWADVPVGDILGGGGLTMQISDDGDQLNVTQQRGEWGFGGLLFTRIDDEAGPDASPSESASANP